ncbi:hypothetical protein ACOSQ4_018655 [Xanthoceras sorbifolium]
MVDILGSGEGLLLLWKKEIEVKVKSFSKGYIDTVIYGCDGLRWRFTGFYGEQKQNQRVLSWTLLRRLKDLFNLPWLIGDDFNKILKDDKKDSARASTLRRLGPKKMTVRLRLRKPGILLTVGMLLWVLKILESLKPTWIVFLKEKRCTGDKDLVLFSLMWETVIPIFFIRRPLQERRRIRF